MNQFRFSCAVDDLALFVSDGWHSLPPQVWVAICKLTGAKPPQRARTAGSIKTVDMQHLLEAYPKESQIIHWVFAKLEEFPHVKTGDMLAFHGIRAEALYFQSDHPPLLPPSPVRRRRGREVQGDPGAPGSLAPACLGATRTACPRAVTSEGLRGLVAQRLGWGVANTPTGPGAATLAGAAKPATAAARADSDGAVDASPTPPAPAGRGGGGGGRPGTASAAGA